MKSYLEKMWLPLLSLVCLSSINLGFSELLYKADFVSKEHVTCTRSFSKIGCFKKASSPNMKMLINDQDPTSPFNKGYLTDMADFAKSTHSLACRCASLAAKMGYTYFSIRFWGQCFVGKDYSNVQKLIDDPKTHRSPNCANPQYQSCNDNHAHECIAWENADYIYSIYGGSRNDPNVDGGYSAWTEFSKCSAECGMGVITRERTCTKPLPKGKGKDCAHLGPASETKECKIKECKVDGGWTTWTKYSVCSKSCGGGVSRRVRFCTNPRPKNGGSYCSGSDMESRSCNPNACPVHGAYSQWGSYGPCTATCGVGEKARVRLCNNPAPAHGGRTCSYLGDAEEKRPCKIKECPIDGGYTAWGPYTRCTKTCGSGTHVRVRLCTKPRPAYGGKACQGPNHQVEPCNTDPCPVHGGLSSWSKYDECSVSCGGGLTARRRTCTNPAPDHGGNDCEGARKQSKVCNAHECPIHGGFTEWTAFGECTKSCAGGVKTRTRTCTNPPPQYGGKGCTGATSNTAACNTHPCPIDGGYTKFGPWVKCSKSCGGGTQIRTRTCTNPVPKYGGEDCASLGAPLERRECETQPCARYTKFGPWSKCSKSCAGGTQKRTRTCYAPGWKGRVDCSHLGSHFETRECETQPCPVNGGWGKWTPWSGCSKSCGNGQKTKSRVCNKPEPAFGGAGCPGYKIVHATCNINPCPINGGWTAFGPWLSCSKPCGGGVQKKVRECTNPAPKHGGKSCAGADSATQACNTHHCPIDGGWTKWGMWRPCSKTCGGGRTYRLRFCRNPSPKYGGERCPGAPIQAKQCGTIFCPVDGNWNSFGAYESCSASCGGGTQLSRRYCNNPTPKYNGKSCGGSATRSKKCNTHHCPIDGKYSAWSQFTPCSFSCGGGTQKRHRECTPPRYGGKPCSVLGGPTDVRECNTQLCPVKQYHTAHACQDTVGKLSCKKGNGKIHILDGMFGRTKRWICGNVDWWNYNCRLPHGKGTVQVSEICEGKQECEVQATTKFFGDPCPLTHKYLEVMYQCYGGRYPDLADEEETDGKFLSE